MKMSSFICRIGYYLIHTTISFQLEYMLLCHNAKKLSNEGKQIAIGSLKKEEIQLKYPCDEQNTLLKLPFSSLAFPTSSVPLSGTRNKSTFTSNAKLYPGRDTLFTDCISMPL
mmetsp:Transcript_15271/g.33131  ORF Transcript_15271/g.33131 Transcript_15271/m.33131 type:complete len:113 (+) Transcript_15271:2-340(+)